MSNYDDQNLHEQSDDWWTLARNHLPVESGSGDYAPRPIEEYLAQPVSDILRTLGEFTAEDIIRNAYEIGLRTGHAPRILAGSLGWRVIESTDPDWQFGLFQPVPERGRPWTAVMPPFAAYQQLQRANVALAHWIYLVSLQVAGMDPCCTFDDIDIGVGQLDSEVQRVANGDHGMRHWWESSVWARNFFGSNAIYTEPIAGNVRTADIKRGYVYRATPQRLRPYAGRNFERLMDVWREHNETEYKRVLFGE